MGEVEALSIGLIGRVRAQLNGVDVALGPTQQRTVLAWLALSVEQPVQRAELIKLLWNSEPPASATNILHTYVKRLRRLLEPDRPARGVSGRLPLIGDGYCLQVDPEAVDVLRARRIIAEASIARQRGQHATVRSLLAEVSSLWTAPVVADLPRLAAHAKVRALTNEWREAVNWDNEAAMVLGQVAEVLPRLEARAESEPFDETAHARLMDAYHLAGRRADAIAAYQRIRTRLAEELGVDPGQDLVSSYRALLDSAPPPARAATVTPSQLPAKIGHFTGRERELAEMTSGLEDARHGVSLLLVTGAGGIGKTTLALETAHRVKDRFPDGQLFVDLRGGGSVHDALPVENVLVQLLRSLGAAPETISRDLAQDLPWYRTLTSGKRLLLVLDNAAEAAQIVPLIPSTPGSAVLVTSRQRLSSLATLYVVHSIPLDTLPADDAIALVGKVIGADRVARERDVVPKLVDLCGRFPLALRIAAAKLAARPLRSMSEFVEDLGHDEVRFSKLAIPGESYSVGAIFASTYHSLSTSAARTFRALGVCPMSSFTVPMIAAMTETSGVETKDAISELHASHLVNEQDAGRYVSHDLVGLFARECARTGDTEAGRTATGERLVAWYLAMASAANRRIAQFRSPIAIPTQATGSHVPPMDTLAEALTVLDNERANLLPVIRYAAKHWTEDAWKLCHLLDAYLTNRGYGPDCTDIAKLGLEAATKLGDDRAIALARGSLGRSQVVVARYGDALENLRAAFEHHQGSDDQLLQAIASKDLALAYTNMRRFDEAIAMYELAARLFDAAGEHKMVAGMLNNVANAYNYLGQPVLARMHLSRAFGIIDLEPDDRYSAAMLATMGGSYLIERDPSAIRYFQQSLRLHRKLGNRGMEAEATRLIGDALEQSGDGESATSHYREAAEIQRSLQDLHAAAITLQRLGKTYRTLGQPGPARKALEESLEIRRSVPYPYLEAGIHHELSLIADLEGGQPARAAHHRKESRRLSARADDQRLDWPADR